MLMSNTISSRLTCQERFAMKRFCFAVVLGLAVWGGVDLMSAAFDGGGLASKAVQAEEQEAKKDGGQPGKVLRHVVLFKFKKDATKEQVQEIVDAFAALKGQIEEIKDFEWGTDVSVENKSEGFTHGFVVSFASEKSRDDYLPHAAHQEFVKLVGPRLDGVLVFDYWAREK
jgi:hypothetical protein